MARNQRMSREQEYRHQSRKKRFSNPQGIYSRYRPDEEHISYRAPFEDELSHRSFSEYDNEDSTDYQRPSFSGRGPKGYNRSDERIQENVCEELTHDHYVDASEIEVKVKEGIVTLEGHVDSRKVKRRAEDLIESLPGVRDVHNRLEIDQNFFERVAEKAKEFISSQSAGPIPKRTPQSESLDPGKH